MNNATPTTEKTMTYDGNTRTSRTALAAALISKAGDCGFTLKPSPHHKAEAVYSRAHHTVPSIEVRVYTTIVEGYDALETRSVGKDAIRVCAVYTAKDGTERGIAKAEKRVNRTGKVADIAGRTYDRMREVYGMINATEKCKCCGAPMFTSKKGNLVCAEVCWAKK